MSDEIPVNPPELPDTIIPHADFPRGETAALLWEFRNRCEEVGKTMGLRFSGAGIGIGGADVQWDLGPEWLIVRISIEDKVP